MSNTETMLLLGFILLLVQNVKMYGKILNLENQLDKYRSLLRNTGRRF